MPIFRPTLLLILASLQLLGIAMPVHAAEFKIADNRTLLEGEIKSGDFEKFARFLLAGHAPFDIYLASPGGDLAEAMKIGRLIRSLKLPTTAPSVTMDRDVIKRVAARRGVNDLDANFMCASACFFVFVAGIHRSADLGDRPKLGIHRPYLTQDDLKKLSSDQAIATAGQVRTTVEKYLKEMSVEQKYADQMFAVPKDTIRWISQDDFEADLDGFVPELKDWVDAQCDKRSDAEKAFRKAIEHKTRLQMTKAEQIMDDALMRKYQEQLSCEQDVRNDLILHAYESGAYLSLLGGLRP